MMETRPVPHPSFREPEHDHNQPFASRADERGTCELPDCTAPVPHIPGRDNVRYCGPEHREAAHLLRRKARYGNRD